MSDNIWSSPFKFPETLKRSASSIYRSHPLKPRVQISKVAVVAALSLISVVVAGAVVYGRGEKVETAPVYTQIIPRNPDITMLPADYSEVEHAPKRPKVRRMPRRRIEGLAIKRTREAILSPVSFSGVEIAVHNTTTKESNGSKNAERAMRTDFGDRVLLPGTIIPGVLLTGINSELTGEILGQVLHDVYDSVSGVELLIPKGTKLVGSYDNRVVYGQERVLISWEKLVLPTGKVIGLSSMNGVDVSGYSGLTDEVDNHYGRLISGVLLSSVLGAGAQVAEGNSFNRYNASFSELAAQGCARNVNEAGQEIVRRDLNVKPTITIRPGMRFNVFVNREVEIEGYRG